MERYNEEMKLWLFDLAHGNLTDSQILSGFVKHYILYDCNVADIQRDIAFHTYYGIDNTRNALENVKRVLTIVANNSLFLPPKYITENYRDELIWRDI